MPQPEKTNEQIAMDYARSAKTCVDNGVDSPECQQELISEGVKQAAIAYGVDPEVAAAAEECFSSHNSEVCAKASAKLAATAACTVATEGAGGPLCAKLAPIVVDAVWPVVGPPLVAAWDMAWGFTDGVMSNLAVFAKTLLGVFGLDFSTDAGPTVNDAFWDLLAAGKDVLLEQWELCATAVQAADVESRRELNLPTILPGKMIAIDGMLGGSAYSGETSAAKFKLEVVQELERWLRKEPGWTKPVYVVIRIKSPMKPGEYQFEIHETPVQNKDLGPHDRRVDLGGMDPNMQKLTIGSPKYIEGTYEVDPTEGWAPWNFGYSGFQNSNARKMWSEAYLAALAVRLEGLKNATTNAVGAIIAANTAQAEDSRRAQFKPVVMKKKEGSVALPLVLSALAVGGVAAYEAMRSK